MRSSRADSDSLTPSTPDSPILDVVASLVLRARMLLPATSADPTLGHAPLVSGSIGTVTGGLGSVIGSVLGSNRCIVVR